MEGETGKPGNVKDTNISQVKDKVKGKKRVHKTEASQCNYILQTHVSIRVVKKKKEERKKEKKKEKEKKTGYSNFGSPNP